MLSNKLDIERKLVIDLSEIVSNVLSTFHYDWSFSKTGSINREIAISTFILLMV